MTAVHYYELLAQEDLNIGIGVTSKRNPAGGILVATQVGIHSLAVGQIAVTLVWNPASVGSLAVITTTVTVPGAALGDLVLASFSLDLAGLILSYNVSSTNTVTITLFNPTAAAIDLASGTVKVLVFKTR